MPMAPVRNGSIYYEEAGVGEVIILLPGLGHDHNYYAKTGPLLSPLGRVVTVDPRGLGQSDESKTGYSVEAWADDVIRLIGHLGAPRAHLVGSSLGACVAMQAALDAPDRIASLVLVAGFSELDRSLEMNFRMRIRMLDEVGLGDTLAMHISMWTLGRSFLDTAEGQAAMERLFASVRRNSPERYRTFINTILRFGRCEPDQAGQPRLTARLGEIRVPTRVVVGEQDILTPVSVSKSMAGHIKGAEFCVVPECGHITFTEKPKETAALIEEFLRRVVKH
jgi:pimeloyl-ACP methyl ester carboxylesterase